MNENNEMARAELSATGLTPAFSDEERAAVLAAINAEPLPAEDEFVVGVLDRDTGATTVMRFTAEQLARPAGCPVWCRVDHSAEESTGWVGHSAGVGQGFGTGVTLSEVTGEDSNNDGPRIFLDIASDTGLGIDQAQALVHSLQAAIVMARAE